MVLENAIEDYLVERVEARGGFTVKLVPIGNKGIPDRLVVLPGAILFVELKRPSGGTIAKLQRWWHSRIRGLGHPAHYVKTKGEVDALLEQH